MKFQIFSDQCGNEIIPFRNEENTLNFFSGIQIYKLFESRELRKFTDKTDRFLERKKLNLAQRHIISEQESRTPKI